MKRTTAHDLARAIREALADRGWEAAVFWYYEGATTRLPTDYYVRAARRWPYDQADLTFTESQTGRAWLATKKPTGPTT